MIYSTEENTCVVFVLNFTVESLYTFREKAYPEDYNPVHHGDGYPRLN